MTEPSEHLIALREDAAEAQRLSDQYVAEGINRQCNEIYQRNVTAGWWDAPREDGTVLCLIHSEISEALEGIRKDKMDDHLPHRPAAEVELADAIIRIFDFAGRKGYDLGGAYIEKLAYNLTRADHSHEARAGQSGKKF